MGSVGYVRVGTTVTLHIDYFWSFARTLCSSIQQARTLYKVQLPC